MIPIPPLVEEVYRAYKSTSREIWNLMERANRHSISVQEETITEMALLHLKETLKDKVHVEQYTTTAEGKNGSDWEWLLIDGERALVFRVQAKRLFVDEKTLLYKHLHYEKNGEYQTVKLINSAREEGVIPLYCFFNYIPDDRLVELGLPKAQPEAKWASLIPSVVHDYSCSVKIKY